MKSLLPRKTWTFCALVLGTLLTNSALYAQSLSPASVTATVQPGGALDVSKTVVTPLIPPRPDICFLADTTGSMGTALNNVKGNLPAIMALVLAAQPQSQ